ncbi:LuxR C-terminal-related transcriptional regulator [Actinomadura sp. 6K520]|uniref:response regulator transcription factor n=1 Tax=Actinomadura sp. 6K520 TaxID=2530364 RepID=UPI001A9F24B8|nr:LuxR C-terminal-related transcriptional regulator [Actinomadura sp. 6K520]
MLEAARPAEMAPLMADAYGFTDGERRVTEPMAHGLSTRQIADRLRVSSYTVQDHLESIFAKSGTGSRGDLTLGAAAHRESRGSTTRAQTHEMSAAIAQINRPAKNGDKPGEPLRRLSPWVGSHRTCQPSRR